MSHAEFIEWAAFASIEPLPEARADLRNALSMLILAHIHKGKGGKKLKLEMFLPDWWADRRDPRRLAAKFMALTANLDESAQGGEGRAEAEGSMNAEGDRRRG